MTLIPLSRDTHAKTRVRPIRSFAFAARTTALPIYGSEIAPFSQEVPIVFLRDGDGFSPAALFGLRPSENLLVDEQGRWLGKTVPNLWKRGPFRVARIEGATDGQMMVCLDDQSELLSETEGEPLFDEAGAASALVNGATALLGQLERDAALTHRICALLARLGLLVPWKLEITQPDGRALPVTDLYQVDEAKIAGIAADDLVALRDMGALLVIYAHLLSLARVSTLVQLTKAAIEREQRREGLKSSNLNLDRAFGIVEDDAFIF